MVLTGTFDIFHIELGLYPYSLTSKMPMWWLNMVGMHRHAQFSRVMDNVQLYNVQLLLCGDQFLWLHNHKLPLFISVISSENKCWFECCMCIHCHRGSLDHLAVESRGHTFSYGWWAAHNAQQTAKHFWNNYKSTSK